MRPFKCVFFAVSVPFRYVVIYFCEFCAQDGALESSRVLGFVSQDRLLNQKKKSSAPCNLARACNKHRSVTATLLRRSLAQCYKLT